MILPIRLPESAGSIRRAFLLLKPKLPSNNANRPTMAVCPALCTGPTTLVWRLPEPLAISGTAQHGTFLALGAVRGTTSIALECALYMV
ncbi:hypothetical protein ACQR1I_00880 [Bradyrhizobium sp. HKCCYLS2038]|uniref:hypothetical protein n=1 Tax=unclassified Bradyrhizobium TaxID=2631580 RepID=UPI003EB69EC5